MLEGDEKKKSFPAIPAALLSMVSVQSGASIAKHLFPVLGASGTSTLRIGLSAIMLFLFNRPNIFKLSKKQWLYCAAYGTCLGTMNLVFYLAIQRIPIGLGVAVEFTGPLAVALLGSRRLQDVVWAALACAGIMLIAPWKNNGIDPLGIMFSLTAGTCWAGYILIGKRMTKIMDNSTAVAVGMLFATLLILPIGVLSGELATLSCELLLIGLSVALLSSAIPYSLDLIALKKLPSKTFSILMSLQPAFGALSGFIFLKEILSWSQGLSILCVVIASIGATVFSQKKKEQPSKQR